MDYFFLLNFFLIKIIFGQLNNSIKIDNKINNDELTEEINQKANAYKG